MSPLILIAAGSLAATAPLPAPQPIQRADLNSTSVDRGVPAHVVTSRTTFLPGATTPWHFHPGQDFVYVVQGAIVLETRGSAPVTLTSGQTHVTPTKAIHRASNPGKSPAVVIAVTMVPDGQQASVPVQ